MKTANFEKTHEKKKVKFILLLRKLKKFLLKNKRNTNLNRFDQNSPVALMSRWKYPQPHSNSTLLLIYVICKSVNRIQSRQCSALHASHYWVLTLSSISLLNSFSQLQKIRKLNGSFATSSKQRHKSRILLGINDTKICVYYKTYEWVFKILLNYFRNLSGWGIAYIWILPWKTDLILSIEGIRF